MGLALGVGARRRGGLTGVDQRNSQGPRGCAVPCLAVVIGGDWRRSQRLIEGTMGAAGSGRLHLRTPAKTLAVTKHGTQTQCKAIRVQHYTTCGVHKTDLCQWETDLQARGSPIEEACVT